MVSSMCLTPRPMLNQPSICSAGAARAGYQCSSLMRSRGQVLSAKQEREIATKVGGRRTPMSGAGDVKNDVRSGDRNLLIECKTVTGDKQITIKARDIEGVIGNALK